MRGWERSRYPNSIHEHWLLLQEVQKISISCRHTVRSAAVFCSQNDELAYLVQHIVVISTTSHDHDKQLKPHLLRAQGSE